MSSSGDFLSPQTHVALLPSAGMGHLTPFLRLASALLRRGCRVTLITVHPTVSIAESQLVSRFLSAFPQVIHLQFNLLPFDSTTVDSDDPFWLRFEATRRSAHLLTPLLSSAPDHHHLSALVYDFSLISPLIPITESLGLPAYILFPSSARMLSLFAYFPTVNAPEPFSRDAIEIPGLSPIPRSSIPPLLFNPNSLFTNLFMADAPKLTRLKGILINSFTELESESLTALNGGIVIEGLPPLFAVGPLLPREEFEKTEWSTPLKWLDEQPKGSVVYVSFGSRTALSREQIREVGEGLVKSGCRFLWVVKDKKVDKEEDEGLNDVVEGELLERLEERGLVVKQWVDQREILSHRAVGGFLSHCGWNSVVEAALYGVRILAWPLHGDQKINAEVVRVSGLGMWIESWGLINGRDDHDDDDRTVVVKGDEIGERVREMMGSEALGLRAAEIGEAARKAADEVGGVLERLIVEWQKKKKSTDR